MTQDRRVLSLTVFHDGFAFLRATFDINRDRITCRKRLFECFIEKLFNMRSRRCLWFFARGHHFLISDHLSEIPSRKLAFLASSVPVGVRLRRELAF
jgi:hypothetical protein